MQTLKLTITGMGCQGCVMAVKNALKAVAGVDAVAVDLAGGAALVEYDSAVTGPDELLAAVNATGYGAALAQAA